MFVNQYDIVEHSGVNHVVLSVENDTLVVLNPTTLASTEVVKNKCTRIAVMNDIRSKAIYDASLGLLTQERPVPKIMDWLSKCTWFDLASLASQNNIWFYNAIKKMEETDQLAPGVVDNFYSEVARINKHTKQVVLITGMYDGCNVTIKLSLCKIGGIDGVVHVKRIFGDDGVFGNIAKQAITSKTRNTNAHVSKSVSNNKPCSVVA